jgi:folate-binding protein YgfZ
MSQASERYQQFRQQGGVADLSDRVKLRFTGSDRVRFLNGQVTADVRKIVAGHSLPACVTTAKGKLCADIFLTATHDTLLLDADASLRESLPARLERYIIADDVTLEDLTETMRLVHLLGNREGEFPGVVARGANRFGHPGLDLFLDPAQFDELWPRLAAAHAVLDEPLRELLRIEAGIPRWGRELTEDTLPPEASLDRTHIDYHKGCYIGQEVISRIKSVGHVNRELTGFSSLDGTALTPGSALFAHDAPEGRAIGTLTSTAWSFSLEKPIALGYLRRGSPRDGLIARVADEIGPQASVAAHPLPFPA